jgi:hypothetical protein
LKFTAEKGAKQKEPTWAEVLSFGWRARRMISGQASVGRTTFATTALRQRRFEWLAVVA